MNFADVFRCVDHDFMLMFHLEFDGADIMFLEKIWLEDCLINFLKLIFDLTFDALFDP